MGSHQMPFVREQHWNRRSSPPDSARTLLSLIRDMQDGKLKCAPHQREPNAWPFQKKKKWIDRNRDAMEEKRQPPLGVFCIYKVLSEECKTSYLNEGLQRVYAGLEAIQDPRKYAFNNSDTVEHLLDASWIYVQHRLYNTHMEAAEDFEEVNNGVGLHKSERFKHLLVYAPNWETIWKVQFDKFSKAIGECLASFTQQPKKRGAALDRERSTRHLFSVAATGRPLSGNDNKPDVEKGCVRAFASLTPDGVTKLVRRCQDLLAEVETAWRMVCPATGEQMNDRLARWCLGVMLVNKDVQLAFWQQFLVGLFTRTNGKANLTTKEGNNIFITNQFSSFGAVCRELGLDPPIKPLRKATSKYIKNGFHADHVDPFVDFGEGETIPVPARLNAAKNARRPLVTDVE